MTGQKTTMQKVVEWIEWYHSIPYDTIEIEELLKIRRALSCELFQYGREIARAYKAKMDTEYQRRKKQAEETTKAFTGGASAAASAEAGRANSMDELEKEHKAEAIYKGMSIIINQGNEVLSCIQQQAAYLRREHNAETTGTGSQ